MNKLVVFIGLVGQNPHSFESSSRGEGRWASSLTRMLSEQGKHEIFIAPDTEECAWGNCKKPKNVTLLQPWEKHHLKDIHFDLAIFTSWVTTTDLRHESRFINADRYLWGIMGWKQGIMNDELFKDKRDYVIRYIRQNLYNMPDKVNFKDRCFLLCQPFRKDLEPSKFKKKRIGWVAKEAFLDEMNINNKLGAKRHLFAAVDACKRTGATLEIFSCHEFDPKVAKAVEELGILDKLKEIDDQVIMCPGLPFPEYQEELKKCSITMPVIFAGSTQEVLMAGAIPFIHKDNMFANHPWIKDVVADLTFNKISRMQSKGDEKLVMTQEEMADRLVQLLTDECLYEDFLARLRPMVMDNLDSHVLKQLDTIMKHGKQGG